MLRRLRDSEAWSSGVVPPRRGFVDFGPEATTAPVLAGTGLPLADLDGAALDVVRASPDLSGALRGGGGFRYCFMSELIVEKLHCEGLIELRGKVATLETGLGATLIITACDGA